MEKTTKDRALMQALVPKEPKQLPSNFPYLTMRRIKEEERMEERRQKRLAIISIIVVALAGIAALLFFIGGVLWHSISSLFRQPDALALVLPTLFCLVFFALVNHWLSRQYHTGIDPV
jgi:type VI protein secretion system component VasF